MPSENGSATVGTQKAEIQDLLMLEKRSNNVKRSFKVDDKTLNHQWSRDRLLLRWLGNIVDSWRKKQKM